MGHCLGSDSQDDPFFLSCYLFIKACLQLLWHKDQHLCLCVCHASWGSSQHLGSSYHLGQYPCHEPRNNQQSRTWWEHQCMSPLLFSSSMNRMDLMLIVLNHLKAKPGYRPNFYSAQGFHSVPVRSHRM